MRHPLPRWSPFVPSAPAHCLRRRFAFRTRLKIWGARCFPLSRPRRTKTPDAFYLTCWCAKRRKNWANWRSAWNRAPTKNLYSAPWKEAAGRGRFVNLSALAVKPLKRPHRKRCGLFPLNTPCATINWTSPERPHDALSHPPHSAMLHMPTGAGKTRTAMSIITRHFREHGPTSVIWFASTMELIDQAASAFEQAWKAHGDTECELWLWRGNNENFDPNFAGRRSPPACHRTAEIMRGPTQQSRTASQIAENGCPLSSLTKRTKALRRDIGRRSSACGKTAIAAY